MKLFIFFLTLLFTMIPTVNATEVPEDNSYYRNSWCEGLRDAVRDQMKFVKEVGEFLDRIADGLPEMIQRKTNYQFDSPVTLLENEKEQFGIPSRLHEAYPYSRVSGYLSLVSNEKTAYVEISMYANSASHSPLLRGPIGLHIIRFSKALDVNRVMEPLETRTFFSGGAVNIPFIVSDITDVSVAAQESALSRLNCH